MNYEQFIDYVKVNIVEILGDDYRASVHQIIKNNDVELDALSITGEDSYISPTIYLGQYFNEYEEGRDIEDLLYEIICLYENNKDKIDFDMENFRDYNKIKDKIAYKLINAVNNQKLLKDVPYIPLLDLAIVFYCIIDSDIEGNATVLINSSHLDLWNIDITQLHKTAVENTPKMLKCELKNMNDVIRDLMINNFMVENHEEIFEDDAEVNSQEFHEIAKEMMSDLENSNIPMYVLTNEKKINGAACLLYNDVLEEFAVCKGEDVYILPSSIHEVILVPALDDICREELNAMVKQVNEEEVALGDVLSNHVYFYRRGSNQICM